MKQVYLWLALCCITLFGSSVFAQDGTKVSPLMDLLAYVPDTPESRDAEMQYISPAALVAPYEAFSGAAPATDEERPLPLVMRASMGSDLFLHTMANLPGVQATTGVSLADMRGLLIFGKPPARGMVLTGGYTVDAVNAAHQNRGFVEQNSGDFTVWCGNAECIGNKADVKQIDKTNFFDYRPTGRKPPVAVNEQVIISSPFTDLVYNAIDAHTANTTLAQSPEFAVLANALTQDVPGELIQAYILPEKPLSDFPVITAASDIPGDPALAAPFIEEVSGYGDLPPTTLLAAADYFDETQDVLILALVYADTAQADAAAAELTGRINSYHNVLAPNASENPVLASLATSVVASVYTDATTGYAVARVAITYPLPENTLNTGPVPHTGRLMVFFAQYLSDSAFYPLWQIEPLAR